jgi:hypothetical protein
MPAAAVPIEDGDSDPEHDGDEDDIGEVKIHSVILYQSMKVGGRMDNGWEVQYWPCVGTRANGTCFPEYDGVFFRLTYGADAEGLGNRLG